MAEENEFGTVAEINEDEIGEGLHVVTDDDAVVDDDVVVEEVSDEETPAEEEEEEDEDPFKIGLEEILDPNGDNNWDER